MRIAVIGDLSGYHTGLLRQVQKLGVVFDHPDQPSRVEQWPDDLHVVQVGDVVHKGPFSELALAIIAEVLLPTGKYTQLIGNHELQYLGGQDFWRPKLADGFDDLLRELHAGGLLHLAAAVQHPQGHTTLVTHAGMTPFILDDVATEAGTDVATLDAGRVAALVNTWEQPAWWRAAGLMLGQQRVEPGVVWAEAYQELHWPWVRRARQGHPPAFDQIHGHTVPLATRVGYPSGVIPEELESYTIQERGTRHLVTTLPGDGSRMLAAIDPGANKRYERTPIARILNGQLMG